MTDHEIEFKTKMWLKVNAEYLKEQAIKKEKERLEEEEAEKEGREIKKKPRKSKAQVKKEKGQNPGGHQTAIEAIEKIVAEKKISTKINYDVLRSLNSPMTTPSPSTQRFDESPASPSIYGSIPINPKSPNPNSVFSPGSPSPNSPMRRLSSFKKDRDLTLKRPQTSAIKGKTIFGKPFLATRSSMVIRVVKFSSIVVMGRFQKKHKKITFKVNFTCQESFNFFSLYFEMSFSCHQILPKNERK